MGDIGEEQPEIEIVPARPMEPGREPAREPSRQPDERPAPPPRVPAPS